MSHGTLIVPVEIRELLSSDATWRTELHTPQGVPSTKGPGSRRYRPYRFASETRALTLSADRVTRKFIDARKNAVESKLSSSREMGPGSRRYRVYRFASDTRALTLSTD
eukprot:983625_1